MAVESDDASERAILVVIPAESFGDYADWIVIDASFQTVPALHFEGNEAFGGWAFVGEDGASGPYRPCCGWLGPNGHG